MRLEIERRAAPSRWAAWLSPVVALGVAIAIGGLVVAALGRSPAAAFAVYFIDPLSDGWSLQELAVKASPLVLIAVGLSFCFRANLWNIGAEGQFVVGGLLGGWLAIATHDGAGQSVLGGWWILPAMLLVGAVGGALYAAIPALLKAFLGVSEILTSLMLVYVAQLGLDYAARGPLRDPHGFNFPQSVMFDDVARLPFLVEGERLHAGVLLALVAVALATFVLRRTLFGFEVRLIGVAPRAGRFAGFSPARLTVSVFLISGACAGLAGITEVAGQIGQLQPSISPGYGFTAIIVAFLGRLSPVGILVAGLVLALTYLGGEGAQIALKLPLDLTSVFQGLVLICVLAADALARTRIRLVRDATPRTAAA